MQAFRSGQSGRRRGHGNLERNTHHRKVRLRLILLSENRIFSPHLSAQVKISISKHAHRI